MSIVAMVTLLLGGCFNNGSPADPPANFTATAGDGRVKLTWTASPGVDYWLFTATDPSLTAFNWANLPNQHAYISAAMPFYMCGLYNGMPYYFAANGRINGGPGGSSSLTISATPYNAGTQWAAISTPANGVPSSINLYGLGYASLTTCSNNSTSATGSFAAVGAGGAIFTSSDGQIWGAQTSPLSTDLYAVTGYAANQNYPANPAMLWVAVGAGGASVYSLDGNSWAVGNPYSAASPALRSIAHVASTFFAVGDAGTILSSTDGITWTPHTSGTPNNLNGVAHGTIYVAVGDSGTVLTSSDGNTWTAQTSGTTSNLRQVTSFGSIIVAVGDAGTIVTSKDAGATWTAQNLGTANLAGVAAESQFSANAPVDSWWGGIPTAQFVVVDSSGNAYTSVSGTNINGPSWSPVAASTGTTSLNALVSSGFGYVAAGNAGATAYAF